MLDADGKPGTSQKQLARQQQARFRKYQQLELQNRNMSFPMTMVVRNECSCIDAVFVKVKVHDNVQVSATWPADAQDLPHGTDLLPRKPISTNSAVLDIPNTSQTLPLFRLRFEKPPGARRTAHFFARQRPGPHRAPGAAWRSPYCTSDFCEDCEARRG